MKHANIEIPQEKPAVVTDAPKSVRPLIASPRVKCYSRYPRIMPLASSNDLAFWKRPNCHQIVLATGHNVFAIWRPANADQATVVTPENIQNPMIVLASVRYINCAYRHTLPSSNPKPAESRLPKQRPDGVGPAKTRNEKSCGWTSSTAQ